MQLLIFLCLLGLCGLLAKPVAFAGLRFYKRFISPQIVKRTPARCRFTPSCSAFMKQAIEEHGLIRGIQLGIDRLRRCNRHNPHFGDDPVPECMILGVGVHLFRTHKEVQ